MAESSGAGPVTGGDGVEVKDLQTILATLPDIEDVKAGRVELTPEQLAAIDRASEVSRRLYESVSAFAKSLMEWVAEARPGIMRALSDLARMAEQSGPIIALPQQPLKVKERESRRGSRRRHSKKAKGR